MRQQNPGWFGPALPDRVDYELLKKPRSSRYGVGAVISQSAWPLAWRRCSFCPGIHERGSNKLTDLG